MKTLSYQGYQPEAHGFGWATCNHALRLALLDYFHLDAPPSGIGADVVFMPLADHDFNPATKARGKINLAYSFFEFDLGPNAAANAAKYDVVFVGSTWCQERCRERGILNTEVLIQGVDHSIFKPGEEDPTHPMIPGPDGGLVRDTDFCGFRIFSGGKFEWRKGQDLVIAAFREFSQRHPDAHLVCSWFNPWPGLVEDMVTRMGLTISHRGTAHTQEVLFKALLQVHGIPADRFTILPQLDQQSLAREMQNTDVGLFPNRCEGGTNLVLMEYAACGKLVVANVKTGHRDVASRIHFAIEAEEDENKWAEQKVEKIVAALELAYGWHKDPISKKAAIIPAGAFDSRGRHSFPEFTWQAAAKKVAAAVERLAGR